MRLLYRGALTEAQIQFYTKAFANQKRINIAGRRFRIFSRSSDAILKLIVEIAETRGEAAARSVFVQLAAQSFYGNIAQSAIDTRLSAMFPDASEADDDEEEDWPGPKWPGPRIER